MPTTTQVERDERRGLIAFLDALGFGEAVITDLLKRGGRPVSLRTVTNDLAITRARGGQPLDGPAATAQIRAVFNQLWAPIQGILASGKDGEEKLTLAQKVGLTHDLWGAYMSRINFEQAFGAMPKEPEKVSIEVEFAEDLEAWIRAVHGRLGPEAAPEFIAVVERVAREQDKLAERLGLAR
ncbi:MAG: hypothetical protein V3U45_08370 [bacterium]